MGRLAIERKLSALHNRLDAARFRMGVNVGANEAALIDRLLRQIDRLERACVKGGGK